MNLLPVIRAIAALECHHADGVGFVLLSQNLCLVYNIALLLAPV
ncbi:MAG TPA: hypothetical protein PLG56_10895 [Lacunisphaera sp.]|nr:hypothetical protein [Lacunisphaera sp.]